MTVMRALFLSKTRKHLRGWIALSFLLVSLIGNHSIGFTHGIAHSGIHQVSTEFSCEDQAPALGHSSANCHLLDALTLAGFVASTPQLYIGSNFFHEMPLASNSTSPARIHFGLYQSRAPPTFIL
jgi:hypothetical protein